MGEEQHAVGLAEMICSLRNELEKARKDAGDSKIKFEVEKVDLELQVNVEKTTGAEGNAGVKFWVVNAGMKGKETNKNIATQTIRLSLNSYELTKSGKRKTSVRG